MAGLVCLRAADWPMLGGRPDRNMVSVEQGLPLAWAGDAKAPTKNIKWVCELGEVTYGAPVIGGGRVFIGTNRNDPAGDEKAGGVRE